jgi:hypothetical protein
VRIVASDWLVEPRQRAGDRSIPPQQSSSQHQHHLEDFYNFAILRNCVRQGNHPTRFTLFGPINVLIASTRSMTVPTMVPGSRQEQHYPDGDLLMVRMS